MVLFDDLSTVLDDHCLTHSSRPGAELLYLLHHSKADLLDDEPGLRRLIRQAVQAVAGRDARKHGRPHEGVGDSFKRWDEGSDHSGGDVRHDLSEYFHFDEELGRSIAGDGEL